MELELTDDQASVAGLFESFFAAESTPTVVRASEQLGFDDRLWRSLVAIGAPPIAVSESCGGGGAGLVEAVLMAESAGRHLAAVPLVEHVVTARMLERAEASNLLAEAVAAESPCTLALHPVDTTGVAPLVPAGAVATLVVALTADGLVVGREPPPMTALPNSAGLSLADRVFDGADLICDRPDGEPIYARALDEWRLLTAAMLVGLSDAALALGVEYVTQREQFGVPIGSFQAIQHGLAELAGPLAGARLLVRRAAWRSDDADASDGSGHQLPVDAVMALAFATELARTLTGRVVHYHGGYGVMEEYDVQLHYRRARGWPAQLGDPALELATLADRLYGVASTGAA